MSARRESEDESSYVAMRDAVEALALSDRPKAQTKSFARRETARLNKEEVLEKRESTINDQLCLLTLLMYILVIIYNEVCFDSNKQHLLNDYASCGIPAIVLTCILTAVGILFCWKLAMFYWVKAEKKMVSWGWTTHWAAFWNTALWWRCLLEGLLCALFPYTFIDNDVFQKVASLLMHLRIFIVIRTFKYRSPVWRERKRIAKISSAHANV